MRNIAGYNGILQIFTIGLFTLTTVGCEASFQAVFLKSAMPVSQCPQGDIAFLLEYRSNERNVRIEKSTDISDFQEPLITALPSAITVERVRLRAFCPGNRGLLFDSGTKVKPLGPHSTMRRVALILSSQYFSFGLAARARAKACRGCNGVQILSYSIFRIRVHKGEREFTMSCEWLTLREF